MNDLFENNQSNVKQNFYDAPKFEVINFDYSDVISVSSCSNDCIDDDCAPHEGCTFVDDTYFY